jgi:hypothetical protein
MSIFSITHIDGEKSDLKSDYRDNKEFLDFKIANVPDFWHTMIEYKELFKYNDIRVNFYLDGCRCYLLDSIHRTIIIDLRDDNYKEVIKLFCTYNFRGFSCMNGFCIIGYSNEIFYSVDNIPYRKYKSIMCDTRYISMCEFIEKIVRENPDYNFAKFNDNSDIKIALKD